MRTIDVFSMDVSRNDVGYTRPLCLVGVVLFVLGGVTVTTNTAHAFVGSSAPSRARRRPSISCNSVKVPTVSQASNEWPVDLPKWARSGWEIDSSRSTSTDTGTCTADTADAVNVSGPPWSATVTNDTPVWEPFLAQTLPPTSSSSVTPVSGFLAPVGGCDNLCNEQERYSDSCTFTVAESMASDTDPPEWLLVRTEERLWTFRLVRETHL